MEMHLNSSIEAIPKAEPSLYVSKYNQPVTRRFLERISGLSTTSIIKLENEGYLSPTKRKYGGLEVATYPITDVHRLMSRKGHPLASRKSAEVITTWSQKGGVSKTTSSFNLGSILSLMGKTLFIDMDPQGDLTDLLLDISNEVVLKEEDILPDTILSLIDWCRPDGDPAPFPLKSTSDVIKKISPNIHLIPGGIDLSEINIDLANQPMRSRLVNGIEVPGNIVCIKEVIDKLRPHYDYIVIDMPPSIEISTVATLFATDRIVIPVETEARVIKIAKRNHDLLKRLSNELFSKVHPGFSWKKIMFLPGKFKSSEKVKIEALAAIQKLFIGRKDVCLSDVVVPYSSVVDRCVAAREPIYSAALKIGKEHKSYATSAKEFTDMFFYVANELMDIPPEHGRFIFAREDIKEI